MEENTARSFRFEYDARVPAPTGTKRLEIWLPLASSDPGVQQIEELEWSADHGKAEIRTDKVFGNRMIHVVVDNPPASTKLHWQAKVTRYVDSGQGSLPSNPRYLAATRLIPITGTARKMAEKLGITDASLGIEKRAKILFDDVLAEMSYDKQHEGWGYGSFEHATTVCKGNCTDFHSRFLGVARAARMPVRFTMGIPLEASPEGHYDSYHCWAHFRQNDHWRPVDISEADKLVAEDPAKAAWFFGHLDKNRISISFGRDVPLVPPAKAGPRNYFVFPYAEADGKAIPMQKTQNWEFHWKDV